MKKGSSPQERIIALEKRIVQQRVRTRELDIENKRLREFVRSLGHDPHDFRYTESTDEGFKT